MDYKEKAKEIVREFIGIINEDGKDYRKVIQKAKKSALVMVKAVLDEPGMAQDRQIYWKSIQKWIESL